MNHEFWDQRYGESGWAYGTAPNDFLRAEAHRIPTGPVLCLAEGEGRNAVHLATLGHEVTAMDQSRVGLDKAGELASQHGVRIEAVCADLEHYEIAPGRWSGIVSIWVHLPSALRARVHRACVAGLAPGGAFLLEAYSPRQLGLRSGGPNDPDRFASVETLRVDLAGLEFEIAREFERDVVEGRFHGGRSVTVQVVGRKP